MFTFFSESQYQNQTTQNIFSAVLFEFLPSVFKHSMTLQTFNIIPGSLTVNCNYQMTFIFKNISLKEL